MLNHTGELPHGCEYCSRKFQTLNKCKRHVDSFHLKLRPHKCNECYRGFSSNKDLKRHLLIHEREQFKYTNNL